MKAIVLIGALAIVLPLVLTSLLSNLLVSCGISLLFVVYFGLRIRGNGTLLVCLSTFVLLLTYLIGRITFHLS
jgi:hypothetical protein